MKNILKILIVSLTIYNLNAMNCSDYKDFQLYNGHYYSVSINRLTFESAKQIAINNGGTLAIPNDAAENSFIQSLIGGGTLAWIGIHDPNKIQNFCYGGTCAYDDKRFRTVTNQSLSYKNFHPQQPDNLVKEYDVVDGKAMVSPLGEHWVAMSGTNGEWLDVGNHADEHNNPVKYKAVFEFENLNDCTPPTDDGIQELTGRFCNSKVWDAAVDVVTMGQTFDCQTDTYGNEYCPEALAPADTYWDYEDGYSVSGVGEVVDYTNKITTTKEVCSTNTGVRMYSNCGSQRNYFNAVSYCNNLIEGGYSDWRLPTLGETATSSGMGGNGVPSCSGLTWTSSVNSGIGRYVWSGSSVGDGYIYDGWVRCVR
jgi:conjugal transfer mating pair stabilization protein TraN